MHRNRVVPSVRYYDHQPHLPVVVITCDHHNTTADQQPEFTASKILPGLYVGNFRDSKDPEQLRENNITHILAIHDNAKKLHTDKEYLCISASDSPGQNLTQYFQACNDFIHVARLNGGNVLIHCLAGVSRSVTVTVAYILAVTPLNWRDALNAVRGARNIANPNFGFQRQLHDYECEKLFEERRRMRDKFTPNPFKDEEECRKLIVAYHRASRLNEPCEAACHRPGAANAPYRVRATIKDNGCLPSPIRLHGTSNHHHSSLMSTPLQPP